MPIDPKITAVRDTPNKSPRLNIPRKGACLHHGALLSFAELRRLAMGGKQVSATNIVKDDLNEQLVADAFRAWSLSSAWGDSAFRTVETCNESTAGWTISDESHWTLARLVAYWAERDGFWPHRDGDPKTWTVLGHREVFTIWGESYATACPGGMDLDLVTKRAQLILRGGSLAGLDTEAIEEDTMTEAAPTIIFGEKTGQAHPYLYFAPDRDNQNEIRRSITGTTLSILRAAGTVNARQKLAEVTMNQNDFDAIPKGDGSR